MEAGEIVPARLVLGTMWATFGDRYRAYRRTVAALLPRPRPRR